MHDDVEVLERKREEVRESERQHIHEKALETLGLREELMSCTLKLRHLESQSKLEMEHQVRERDKAREERDMESVQVARLSDKLREAEAAASMVMQRYQRILSVWAARLTSGATLSSCFGVWRHHLKLTRFDVPPEKDCVCCTRARLCLLIAK